jgi:two-component system, chemotaxis family, chemotaxis protein CheY
MSLYILCVDDDREVLDSLRRDLEDGLKNQFSLEFCQSAAEADSVIEQIQDQGGILGLVISDQVMPEEDGIHFLERLHKRQPWVRKILLTGFAGIESAIYGINHSGLSRYFEKPWDKKHLVETIKLLLGDAEPGK